MKQPSIWSRKVAKITNTKKVIADSFAKLMERTSLSKISIQSIVDECGLNRQTFYYHFKDILDLIEWIFCVDGFEKEQKGIAFWSWEKGLDGICAHLQKNSAYYLKIFHSNARMPMETIIRAKIFELLCGAVDLRCRPGSVSEKEQRMIADFYTCAVVGQLFQWIDGGMTARAEEFCAQIRLLMEGALDAAIQKYSLY